MCWLFIKRVGHRAEEGEITTEYYWLSKIKIVSSLKVGIEVPITKDTGQIFFREGWDSSGSMEDHNRRSSK